MQQKRKLSEEEKRMLEEMEKIMRLIEERIEQSTKINAVAVIERIETPHGDLFFNLN